MREITTDEVLAIIECELQSNEEMSPELRLINDILSIDATDEESEVNEGFDSFLT